MPVLPAGQAAGVGGADGGEQEVAVGGGASDVAGVELISWSSRSAR
ncbi:MAG TPA: hypothetical protein VJX66_17790 [Amycolatopsis sp.]|nr:hypothetical protein [Amycolatopsis sp.]